MYTLYRSIILERTRKCCKRFEVSFTALFRLQILAKFVNFWWENVQINLRFVGNNLSSKYGNTDNLWDEKMSTNNLSFKHRVFAIVIHFFLRKMSQLHKTCLLFLNLLHVYNYRTCSVMPLIFKKARYFYGCVRVFFLYVHFRVAWNPMPVNEFQIDV